MASNNAAWITAAKATPFEVGPAPMETPVDNEILIRNHYLAINPIDGALQAFAWWPLEYPNVLGQDVAGEVAAVGPKVTRFKVGDRLLGHACGMTSKKVREAAFQNYSIVVDNMASPIPDSLSYEKAVVIPLGFSTAACGLFQDDLLKLQLPTHPAKKSTGKTLLIWGGSSSVGSNAIQQAVAAGYEVITTASPKNFDYVKKLGASLVFDHNSSTVVADIVAAFKGKTSVGALDCIGGASFATSLEVIEKVGGKFVATVKPITVALPTSVGAKQIMGASLRDNDIGKAVYEDFLPVALEAKSFVASPPPLVAGEGLESIQAGVDLLHKKGVSASKVVIKLI